MLSLETPTDRPLLKNNRWPLDRIQKWYKQLPWLTGCNYLPYTAVNVLEMWQKDTFDIHLIDKELGWAAELGFNTMRVFLHYLLWQDDQAGFRERLQLFLTVCHRHRIRPILVLFDDCWNAEPHLGPQPAPLPGMHNSRWVQCPGHKEVTDPALYPVLQDYTQGMLKAFGHDERVLLWDLYNEPGNSGHIDESLPLLTHVFEWARQVSPMQPLTCGIWRFDEPFERLNRFQLDNSDVVSFHTYVIPERLQEIIDYYKSEGRPMICTEYMARTLGSTFIHDLPIFKKENIGALNWGLVSGKSNTIYPWGSPEGSPEPDVWFHDIYRPDKTPFDAAEVAFIKTITGVLKA